jgi:succinyl-diaminopimelate desuccinylase
MIDRHLLEKIARRIDGYRDEMIQLQIHLTSIPAIAPENGGDGEYEKAKYLKRMLEEFGFKDILEIKAPDSRTSSGERPNLIVRYSGEENGKTVWIMSHMDIVPPGEISLWQADPYQGYVRGGKIYGRGMEDNQQDLVASLFAAKACLDEGLMLMNRIGLIFIADEETASDYGISYILSHEQNPFRITDSIVVPDSGNPEGTLIEIAEKSILWLRFRTLGKQCHGSKPHLGKNAFLAASQLVVNLHHNLHKRFNIPDTLFDPPLSTFQPTRKDGNVPNVNTIPGEDVFYMDCRILPMYNLDEVQSAVRGQADEVEKLFGVAVEISEVQKVQASEPTAMDAPIVGYLKEAIREVYNIDAEPKGIGAGTVAAYLRKAGYPVAVWCRTENTAHQPNEYCIVDNMIGNCKVFAHLFLQNGIRLQKP